MGRQYTDFNSSSPSLLSPLILSLSLPPPLLSPSLPPSLCSLLQVLFDSGTSQLATVSTLSLLWEGWREEEEERKREEGEEEGEEKGQKGPLVPTLLCSCVGVRVWGGVGVRV